MFKLFSVLMFIFLSPAFAEAKMVHYTMNASIRGYVGVGGKIDGVVNPILTAQRGDMVMITLMGVENMPHDIKFEGHNVKSPLLRKKGDSVDIHFTAEMDDIYICSLPGHASAGMKGKFMISSTQEDPEEDSPEVDDVVKKANDIPPAINYNTPREVVFDISAVEVESKLDDGSTYEYWTYNGTVPGPMLRVREGDTVVVNLKNLDHDMVHSIDFHAAQMNHGGAHVLQVPPMETRTLKFVAKKAGLFVYHCATPHVPTHLAKGMYGMILVEPAAGLSVVDQEFYVMQGEYYTKELRGFQGHHQHDEKKLLDEKPTYIVMNGRPQGLTGSNAMKARAGDSVRIFFGAGGPNLISSFHVIGEIFDKVYPYGSFLSVPFFDIQTVLVPAGGATIVEFIIDEPGHYVLVDHSLSRVEKGASAIIEAH
ncbi:MAG: copper-containing nitrite reductase [Bacteriovoracaceae bacterium]|nr:copper-containing nitrite reductase [Bacteriovoracaceae bacterium]